MKNTHFDGLSKLCIDVIYILEMDIFMHLLIFLLLLLSLETIGLQIIMDI